MNLNKICSVALLAITAMLAIACSSGATPTRSAKALADNNPTQTPWIIYVPVTNTPEPFTITPLPTVGSSKPTAAPTNTRPKPAATAAQPVALAPTAAPTNPPPPTAIPTPSCGQIPTIVSIDVPETRGTTRETSEHGGSTVEFVWSYTPAYDLDPTIGFLIDLTSFKSSPSSPINRQHIYIPFNVYRQIGRAILDKDATWHMTNTEDVSVNWTVTVVKASTTFNQQTYDPGPMTPCGPPLGPYTFGLRVH